MVYPLIREVEMVLANLKVEKKVIVILLDPLDLGEIIPKYRRKLVPKKKRMTSIDVHQKDETLYDEDKHNEV